MLLVNFSPAHDPAERWAGAQQEAQRSTQRQLMQAAEGGKVQRIKDAMHVGLLMWQVAIPSRHVEVSVPGSPEAPGHACCAKGCHAGCHTGTEAWLARPKRTEQQGPDQVELHQH